MQNRFFHFRFLLVTIILFFVAGSFTQLPAKAESGGDMLEFYGLALAQNNSQPPAGSPRAPSAPPEGNPPPPPADAPSREPPNSRPHGHPPEHEQKHVHRGDEMEVLDRLLTMPPEKLARIRRALEKIETMTPEEREQFRQRLREIREISPEKRREMREEWRKLSREERRESIKQMRERPWKKVLEEEKTENEPDDSQNPDSEK